MLKVRVWYTPTNSYTIPPQPQEMKIIAPPKKPAKFASTPPPPSQAQLFVWLVLNKLRSNALHCLQRYGVNFDNSCTMRLKCCAMI